MAVRAGRAPIRKSKVRSRWPLQDAKAHLSELVRRAEAEGPQHVTIHGRDAAVIVSKSDYERLTGGRTGRELVKALAASPHKDIELEQPKFQANVSRPIKL